MKTDFPDPANLLSFKIILNPDEGEPPPSFLQYPSPRQLTVDHHDDRLVYRP